MIRPKCPHYYPPDVPLHDRSRIYITSCEECYHTAVRANILDVADSKQSVLLREANIELKRRIQALESDNQDMRSAPGLAFVRCQCERLVLAHHDCPHCGRKA